MIRKPVSNTRYWICCIVTILGIIAAYLFLSYKQKIVNPQDTTIPDIGQFWSAIKTLSKPDAAGEIWILDDLEATYTRHILGMISGVFMSLVVGILMGCNGSIRAALKFPIKSLSKIPPTAMIAVYFVLFGTNLQFYVAIIAFGIFPTLAQSVYQSVKTDVSDDAIYKAYTLGASDWEVVFNVIIPQIMPRFIEAIRMTIGPALVFIIAAEWMMSDVGIGYRLRIQSRLLNMNIVYIYLVILCLTSYFMDWTLSFAKMKLCPWHKDQ